MKKCSLPLVYAHQRSRLISLTWSHVDGFKESNNKHRNSLQGARETITVENYKEQKANKTHHIQGARHTRASSYDQRKKVI